MCIYTPDMDRGIFCFLELSLPHLFFWSVFFWISYFKKLWVFSELCTRIFCFCNDFCATFVLFFLFRCRGSVGSFHKVYTAASARAGQVTHPAAISVFPGSPPRCPSSGLLSCLKVETCASITPSSSREHVRNVCHDFFPNSVRLNVPPGAFQKQSIMPLFTVTLVLLPWLSWQCG